MSWNVYRNTPENSVQMSSQLKRGNGFVCLLVLPTVFCNLECSKKSRSHFYSSTEGLYPIKKRHPCVLGRQEACFSSVRILSVGTSV